jgi:GAF domain-containing protein
MASDDQPKVPRRPDEAGELKFLSGVRGGEGVVDTALRLVMSLAQASLGGADGVSVALRRHESLVTVAATDRTISDLDAHQHATGEGPCLSASVEGRRFHARSLVSETRWPVFTPKARSLGINAVLSAPLLIDDRPVGALNIYSLTPAAFSLGDEELASLFAAEASVILSNAGADTTEQQLSSSMQISLRVREVIALAQGILMERLAVGEYEAFDALRRSSQESGRPLHHGAEEIVASTRARTGTARPDQDEPHE